MRKVLAILAVLAVAAVAEGATVVLRGGKQVSVASFEQGNLVVSPTTTVDSELSAAAVDMAVTWRRNGRRGEPMAVPLARMVHSSMPARAR
jgi:hypothetical protein